MATHRLGLFGGTFDPIHTGHVIAAESVHDQLALDEMWFIPARVPPHKEAPAISAEDRFAMVEAALQDHPAFTASRLDLDRPGPSYAEDTLDAVRNLRPNDELYYIIGADMLRDLHTWRHPDRIVTLAHFVAVARPGDALDTGHSAVAARVELLHTRLIDISSSDIRTRVAAGKSIRYLVPSGVAAYIEEYRLYVGPNASL